MSRAALAAALFLALPAAALENAGWPPQGETAQRMRELQQAIVSPGSTAAQRDAARAELGKLLMSPAARERGMPPGPRAPRAAVEPLPPSVAPARVAPPAVIPPAEVARVEVIVPAPKVVSPQTGTVVTPLAPNPSFAVDPRTGGVLHPSGAGYVDPRTGQFTPR